jgi:hypothetical protein
MSGHTFDVRVTVDHVTREDAAVFLAALLEDMQDSDAGVLAWEIEGTVQA